MSSKANYLSITPESVPHYFRDANYNQVAYDGSPLSWRVSCYGLYIHEEKLLVIKNHIEQFYDIPGGGIEPHETIAAGLARESREEAGWHFELGPIVDVHNAFFYHTSEKKFYHSLQLYSLVLSAKNLGTAPEETTQTVLWIPVSEVAQAQLYPNAKAALAKAVAQNLV